MLDCELKGYKACFTAGCYFKMANVTMALCRIHNHRLAGMVVEGKPGAKVNIMSSTVTQNNVVGIYVLGSDSHAKIKKNEVAETNGPAIFCSIGTGPHIMENLLTKNRSGVYVESADPLIFRNEIFNCSESGVIFTTVEESACRGEMAMCTVRESEENGVLVKGLNCSPKVHSNLEISLSKLAGIKVTEKAHPTLSNNVIKNNLAQGILLVEGASAHISRNIIDENMKANIAFGGMLSGDTIIHHNTIINGRAEGIFMIEGEHTIITKNKIKKNMDGILLSSANPLISENNIEENRRCGIIMVSHCDPKLFRNLIINNYMCGILMRQNSMGIIEKNEASFPHSLPRSETTTTKSQSMD